MKKSLTTLTDEAIALMQQMRAMGENEPGYLDVKRQWYAVQEQIARIGNHSPNRSALHSHPTSRKKGR